MENKNYVAYDYLIIRTTQKNQNERIIQYESLGWEVAEIFNKSVNFRRKKTIPNKLELLKQQQRLTISLEEIKELEILKTKKATIVSCILGTIFSLILGSGLALCLEWPDQRLYLVIGVVLGSLGIIGCLVNYLVYKKIKQKTTVKADILIHMKRDDIDIICSEAFSLI